MSDVQLTSDVLVSEDELRKGVQAGALSVFTAESISRLKSDLEAKLSTANREDVVLAKAQLNEFLGSLQRIEVFIDPLDIELTKAKNFSALAQRRMTDKNGVSRIVWVKVHKDEKTGKTKETDINVGDKVHAHHKGTGKHEEATVVKHYHDKWSPKGTVKVKFKDGTEGYRSMEKIKHPNEDKNVAEKQPKEASGGVYDKENKAAYEKLSSGSHGYLATEGYDYKKDYTKLLAKESGEVKITDPKKIKVETEEVFNKNRRRDAHSPVTKIYKINGVEVARYEKGSDYFSKIENGAPSNLRSVSKTTHTVTWNRDGIEKVTGHRPTIGSESREGDFYGASPDLKWGDTGGKLSAAEVKTQIGDFINKKSTKTNAEKRIEGTDAAIKKVTAIGDKIADAKTTATKPEQGGKVTHVAQGVSGKELAQAMAKKGKKEFTLEGESAPVGSAKARELAKNLMISEHNEAYQGAVNKPYHYNGTTIVDGFYYGENKMHDSMPKRLNEMNGIYFKGSGWRMIPDGGVKTKWDKKQNTGIGKLKYKVVKDLGNKPSGPKKASELEAGEHFFFNDNEYIYIESHGESSHNVVLKEDGKTSIVSFGGEVNKKHESGFGDYLKQGGREWD